METLDLPVIWALIIALSVFLYVVLDGFDLGVGILLPLAGARADRDTMMRAVAPAWDGNEIWLAIGGVGLFAAFPKAFAAFMPSVYLPMAFLLAALVVRALAVQWGAQAGERGGRLWGMVFAAGSIAAAAAQGFVLGAFVQGTSIAGARFTGGAFDWFSAFTLLVAAGVVAGYALLGATWLVLKTRGDIAARARGWAERLAFVALAALIAVSICVLALDVQAGERWGITWPLIDLERLLPLVPIPAAAVGLVLWLRRAVATRRDGVPFFCAVGLFTLAYLGLAISLFPYVVPYRMTIWQAAASPGAQAVLLLGILVLLPLALAYTGYVYWVFRGHVAGDAIGGTPRTQPEQ